jgi:CheY-like chemotaxis protein
VAGTLRFRELLPAVHVLIHTGTAPSGRHTAALVAGACRVLTKDHDPRHLLAETVRCAQPHVVGATPDRRADQRS